MKAQTIGYGRISYQFDNFFIFEYTVHAGKYDYNFLKKILIYKGK